jgi:hypothetical protein
MSSNISDVLKSNQFMYHWRCRCCNQQGKFIVAGRASLERVLNTAEADHKTASPQCTWLSVSQVTDSGNVDPVPLRLADFQKSGLAPDLVELLILEHQRGCDECEDGLAVFCTRGHELRKLREQASAKGDYV